MFSDRLAKSKLWRQQKVLVSSKLPIKPAEDKEELLALTANPDAAKESVWRLWRWISFKSLISNYSFSQLNSNEKCISMYWIQLKYWHKKSMRSPSVLLSKEEKFYFVSGKQQKCTLNSVTSDPKRKSSFQKIYCYKCFDLIFLLLFVDLEIRPMNRERNEGLHCCTHTLCEVCRGQQGVIGQQGSPQRPISISLSL